MIVIFNQHPHEMCHWQAQSKYNVLNSYLDSSTIPSLYIGAVFEVTGMIFRFKNLFRPLLFKAFDK